MKNKLKTSKGITLIALVITIIVLLILAGIAISMLSGDNGILNQATKAKQRTEQASVEEQIKLATTAAMANEKHKIESKEELIKELAKYGLKLDDEESDTWTVTDGKITYKIDSNGNVAKEEEKSAADIKNDADIIGAKVTNYKPIADTTTEWRIFLADNDHIYLIAKDYISLENLPLKDGIKPENTDSQYPKAASLTNVIDKYTGSKNIVDNEILKSTIPTYHQWVNIHQDSTNENIKAIAYLLDTEIWTAQYGTEKAEYVIGGPTIEMFVKSYNTKGGHANGKEIIEISAENDNGYQVKWAGDEKYVNYINGLSTDEYEYLFVLDESDNRAKGYWQASPSARSIKNVMRVLCGGYVSDYGGSGENFGFRPIVCLNSDVKLMGNPTDGYTIQ